mmetsp:Transcript_17513/g.51223  ORF Transcript_17513/g.51223 Transcript_17513/m.51223 type:complete len:274 (-) Transcript_17513:959-1780(-)
MVQSRLAACGARRLSPFWASAASGSLAWGGAASGSTWGPGPGLLVPPFDEGWRVKSAIYFPSCCFCLWAWRPSSTALFISLLSGTLFCSILRPSNAARAASSYISRARRADAIRKQAFAQSGRRLRHWMASTSARRGCLSSSQQADRLLQKTASAPSSLIAAVYICDAAVKSLALNAALPSSLRACARAFSSGEPAGSVFSTQPERSASRITSSSTVDCPCCSSDVGLEASSELGAAAAVAFPVASTCWIGWTWSPSPKEWGCSKCTIASAPA